MAVVFFRHHSFICCVLLIIISQASAQPSFLSHFCDNTKGNFTANSTYQTNLNTLLSNLTSDTKINYGFYNSSYGQNTDKVNAIGLCRGDVKPRECRLCLNFSKALLTQLCPNQKEAISYHDNCMLRYTNRSIFGVMETSPYTYTWNTRNATDVDQFNQVLGNLLRNLTPVAASGDSRLKYATGNASASNFETIFGLVQCTPDLSEKDCNDCLVGAISEISSNLSGKIGGRVLRPSCNIRYEIYRFYGERTMAYAPAPSPFMMP